jgi:hypothetical protein
MLLNISTLSGCLPPIEVSHDATTGDLKRRIQEVCPETASKRLRVMQRHEPSDEFAELDQIDQRLSSRGVSDGSELSLVIEELRAVDRVRSFATIHHLQRNCLSLCFVVRPLLKNVYGNFQLRRLSIQLHMLSAHS